MNEGTKVDKVLSVLIEKLTPLLETIKSVEKECSENEEKRQNALVKSIDKNAEYYHYASAKATYEYGENIRADILTSQIDVQINGTSIVKDGVANIPIGSFSNAGVVRPGMDYGTFVLDKRDIIAVFKAYQEDINDRKSMFRPIVPFNLDYAVKAAMCDGKGAEWTEEEKAAARTRLGVDEILNTLQGNIDDVSAGGGSNTIYPSLTDGSVDYTNGEVSDDSAGGVFKRTDYINLGVLKTVSIKHNFWGYSTKGFAFFDKNKMFISGYLYVMELNETDIPDNAAYIMFTTHDLEKKHTEEKYVTIESAVGFAEEIKSEIAGVKKQVADITQDISVTKDIVSNIDDMVIEAVTPYPNEYESATRIQSSINRICVLESMPLSLKGLIELEVYNGLSTEVTTQVYLLNEKYTVLDVINIQIPAGVGKHTISTTLYSDGSKTVFVGIKDTSAFLCATGKSGYPWGWTDIVTPSIGDVLTITRQIPSNDLAVTPIIKCPANTERIARIEDTLEDTLAQGNKNKFVHYSLDDCLFWVDLIKNENNYASCFENPALALLKEMHDEYGCCITLCCLVSSDNYSIQDVPSKFAAEFSANKDWLRFAFHGTTVQELFNTDMPDTIAEYYRTFVNGIYKMTNDVDCIDRITRLSSFTGTLANIKAIRDSACGVTGLLCGGTDNNYNSYYLSNDDNSYIRTHGKIYDSVNHMWLLSTQRRLEARDQVLDNFTGLALANFNPCIELFWHEDQATPAHTGTIAKIKSIMNWFNTNGYMNAFTADVLHIN